jgi:hypothetical protein
MGRWKPGVRGGGLRMREKKRKIRRIVCVKYNDRETVSVVHAIYSAPTETSENKTENADQHTNKSVIVLNSTELTISQSNS